VTIAEEPAVRVVCAAGSKTSIAIPMQKQYWTRVAYSVHFEPECDELWVSSAKGWIEAGAIEYPFVLFYKPEVQQTFETKLLVDVGTETILIPVLASTGSEAGVAKRRHRHQEE
jgi:hypothetical protein